MKLNDLWHRIYSDFFMPSRIEEYGDLLKMAVDCGYLVNSIISFWELIKSNNINSKRKYLIIRHDIDTDIETAKAMWEIECKFSLKSSFYFRLSTIDIGFMRDIDRAGSEASYHYEEVATFAKHNGIRSKAQILENLSHIRDLFKNNLNRVRLASGLPMKIVASHGDFINRKLGVTNQIILEDPDYRNAVGIELEVYDDVFMKYVTSRHSDTHYPLFWKPSHPLAAFENSEKIVYLLIHPRHWRTNIKANMIDDINRLHESWKYFFKWE